jgi:hypothetical protein
MIRISILAALMFCTATAADAADGLYSAQTVVTGQGEANRANGFASCLEDVLIKVSGAVKLAGDPRLSAYQSRAGDFVNAHTSRPDVGHADPRRAGHPRPALRFDRRVRRKENRRSS